MENLNRLLLELIEKAEIAGLSSQDADYARNFLAHREYGLCFDTIVTQLYEYEIATGEEFYSLVVRIAEKMHIAPKEYAFLSK